MICTFAGLEKLEMQDVKSSQEEFDRMKFAVNGALAILSEAPSSVSGQPGAAGAGVGAGRRASLGAHSRSGRQVELSSWSAERVQSWLQENDIDFLSEPSASPFPFSFLHTFSTVTYAWFILLPPAAAACNTFENFKFFASTCSFLLCNNEFICNKQ